MVTRVCILAILLTAAPSIEGRILGPKLNLRNGENETITSFAAFISEKLDIKPIPDPTCKKGVASPDLKACCTDECGSCGENKLCGNPGKYNEATGKLVDNCCKSLVLANAPSCDKTHPPCVLSPDYALQLKSYMFTKPKRHALDDCNKAPEIVRAIHALGVDRGEFLAKLYVDGKTMYEDALDICVKVEHLVKDKMGKVEAEQDPIKAKISGATDSDKIEDPLTGISKLEKWKEELEQSQNEMKFYEMILKNEQEVNKDAKTGLKNVVELRGVAIKAKDLEKAWVKLNALIDDAKQVYTDAELLWKQWVDSGKDYSCGPPPAVEHTKTQCDNGNTKYSYKCAITCEVGYDGNGTKNALRCLKQGKFGKELYGEWQGMATCIGRNCGFPAKIEKSKTTHQEIRYPNAANYNCHEGHSVDGSATADKAFSVQCESAGRYAQNISHQCLKIKCGRAPDLKHAEEMPGIFYYQDTLTYKCLKGYTVDASPGGLVSFPTTCKASGRFTTTQQCKPVRCGPAPDFTNTKLAEGGKGEKHFSEKVSYTCEPGYSLDQKFGGETAFVAMCGDKGEFHEVGLDSGAGVVSKCRPVSAGMSPDVPFGNVVKMEMFYGDDQWVQAENGFSYEETPTSGLFFILGVSTEGQYTGIKEFKPVSCGKPPALENSKQQFDTDKAVYGDVLSYQCDAGYSVDKTDVESAFSFAIQCESDADFSKVPGMGECLNVDDCAQHTCGPFGSCVDGLEDYSCKCEDGYEENVDEVSKEKLCGNIDDCGPEACGVGKCIDKLESFDCKCPEGYKVIGEGESTTCAAKTCGLPPNVGQAATVPPEAQSSKQFYSQEVVYQCATGHTLDGKAGGKNHQEITCQASKQWTESKDCKPIECGEPVKVEFATTPAKTTFDKEAKYKCDKGYTVDGSAEGDSSFSVTCKSSAQYSLALSCLPVSCGEPEDVANAARDSGRLYFPNKREYSCLEGFTLDGKASSDAVFKVECSADGKLSKPKQCLAVVCGLPLKHINAFNADPADEGVVAYPQVTVVTCRDGYTVGGDPTGSNVFGVSCQADGKFSSYDKRECQPVVCGAPPKLVNSELDMSSLDTCDCYACGKTEVHNSFDICGPRSPICSPVNDDGGGCYTKNKAGCDCSKRQTTSPVGQNLNFEEKASYKCLPGFTAGGEHDATSTFSVECLKNGEFSAPATDMQCRNVNACEQHTCGPKGECKDVVGVSITDYECECIEGFEVQMVKGEKHCGNIDDCGSHQCGPGVCEDLVGDYTCKCPSGHYIATLDGEKTCVPVECAAKVPDLDKGKLLTDHSGPINFPTSLRFECEEGYSTDASVGEAKRKFHANCKADGTFYGMLSCQPVSCGTPTMFSETTLVSPTSTTSLDYKEEAKYECFAGHAIGGRRRRKDTTFSVKCQKDGTISDPKVCDPVECGSAPEHEHTSSSMSGDVFFGAHLEYRCNTGFSLNGLADGGVTFTQSCLETGEFSETDKVCQPMAAASIPAIEGASVAEFNGKNMAAAYLMYDNDGCNGRNELGISSTSLAECQALCDAKTSCVSFEFKQSGRKCQLSSSCTYDLSEKKSGSNWLLYVKSDRATAYKMHDEDGCNGRNELGTSSRSLAECQALCDAESSCISFEFKTGSRKCQLSSTCTYDLAVKEWEDDWFFYEKHDRGICSAEMYQHGDFKGWKVVFPVGEYNHDAMVSKGAVNDDASSLKVVGVGCNAEIYQHDFDGWKASFTTGSFTHDKLIDAGAKNDDLSSIKVFQHAVYQDSIEYKCHEGFTVTGGASGATKFSARVDASGNWVPTPPEKCLLIAFSAVARMKDSRNGNALNGAKVTVGDHSATSTSGLATVEGIQGGTYTVKYEASGYITLTREVTVTGNIAVGGVMDVSMSPVLATDQWRGVLKWNENPRDLDSYAQWGSSKVCWYGRNQRGSGLSATLEKDDTNGFGPETIYMSGVGHCAGSSTSCDIQYRINDYTESGNMLAKGAEVTLYTGDTVAGHWKIGDCASSVDTAEGGNWWHVLTIDGRTNKIKWSCDQPPVPAVQNGLKELIYYFGQGDRVPNLNGRTPAVNRVVSLVNYAATSGKWSGFTKSDDYAVRWEGAIRITTAGSYTFYLTSDDGSKMWIDQDTVINNNGLHGMKEKSGASQLSAALHAIKIDYFEKGGGAGCIFKYSGADSSNQKKVVPARVLRVNPVLGGLKEEVFYFDQGGNVPTLTGRTPNGARYVDEVNYQPTSDLWPGFEQTNHFAVRWTGFLEVNGPGEYTFYITSDDGSKLYLDSQLVNNDGLHGMQTKSGTKTLDTGFHAMRMEMFEKGGGAGAKLEYKGPDSNDAKMVIPKAYLKQDAGLPATIDVYAGLREEQYYFGQGNNVPASLHSRVASKIRNVDFINYRHTSSTWSGFTRKNDFAVRWTGSVKVITAGSYQFQIESDDGSKLYLGGSTNPLANNDGLHGMRKKQGTKSMSEGLTAVRIVYFEKGGGAGMNFKFKGADTGGAWKVVPKRSLVSYSTLPGLLMEAYYLSDGAGRRRRRRQSIGNSLSSMYPMLRENRPNVVRTSNKQINYGNKNAFGLQRDTNFAIRWSGTLMIRAKDNYQFWITSDDGSTLFVDRSKVVDNDGLHGRRTKDGKKTLDHGQHSLQVYYFQKGGGANMKFEYQGKDTNNQRVLCGGGQRPQDTVQQAGPTKPKFVQVEKTLYINPAEATATGTTSKNVLLVHKVSK